MSFEIIKPHHTPSRRVTKENLAEVREIAWRLVLWLDTMQGNFPGEHGRALALHHAQVSEEPFDFFVVAKEFLPPEKAKPDWKQNHRNFWFPARVIVNADMVTALPTYLEKVSEPAKDGKEKIRTVAVANTFYPPEGCMSFPHRKAKHLERFNKITVRYDTFGTTRILRRLKLDQHVEELEGVKAHVFQHEMDHAAGIDIFHGDGERKEIPIDERLRENYRTKAEIEEEAVRQYDAHIARILEKNTHGIIEDLDGNPYRWPISEEVPKGYVEGGTKYYHGDGALKSEVADAPILDHDHSEQRRGKSAPARV